MNDAPNGLAQLYDLAGAQCEGILTAGQATQLQELVIGSRELRYHYILYTHIHALAEMGRCPAASEVEPRRTDVAELPFVHSSWSNPSSSPPTLALAFLSTALRGAIGSFPEGMPLAYLVATVVTGLGILIASHVYMSQPEQFARQSTPLPTPLSHLPSVVGRITGMVDCKWEEGGLGIRDWGLERGSGVRSQGTGTENHQSSAFQSLIPNPQSLVSLGDQFALASGLVEITYDTGTRSSCRDR